ncbi:MAG: ABC transporter permease [Chloroflexi bacterium]|nr:ABC transporter permease [Chloroflexota bacterium]
MMWLVGRIVSALFTIWLAVTLVFIALRLLPGDAVQSQLLQSGASAEIITARRAQQGMDAPWLAQYGHYWIQFVQGNLGYSLSDGQAVTDLIFQRLEPTLMLAGGALLVGCILGISLGIAGGTSSLLTPLAQTAINLALSTPIYWTGTLAIWIFAVQMRLLPSAGGDGLSGLVMPVVVLGFHTSGGIGRAVEGSVRKNLNADFVRTARSKGLPEALVLRRHVLRVGLLPVITVIALQTGFLLGGAVITESLFVRPGLGRLLLDSTLQQDYPVVQGITALIATAYTLVNVAADALYTWFDPRITAQRI